MPVNETIRRELLAAREEDIRVRDEVVRGKSLYDGYDPRMEAVHRRNAARLKQIIAEYGWPGHSLVGEDGALAAWFIVQHAISDPPFQRQCLELLRDAVTRGEASPAAPAYLEDRICMFEGRPQVYGTQFEPDEQGLLRPYAITDPDRVNERRRAIGLNTIEERTKQMRAQEEPEYDPQRRAQYEQEFAEWLKKVGWRT